MRGFLFEHSRPDLNSPGGVRRTKIAAIAETRRDALDLAADILPMVGLRLLDEGREAFQVAEAAGVSPGEAKAMA